MRKTPPGTLGLIIANGLLFALTYMVEGMENKLIDQLALFFPLNENFQAWQLVTNMFMHGSLPHLFFNMFGLYTFGLVLETLWGTRKFLAFYFITGIGAGIIYLSVNFAQFNGVQSDLSDQGIPAELIQERLDAVDELYGKRLEPRDYQAFTYAGIDFVSTDKRLEEDRLVDFYGNYSIPALGASGAIYGILVAFCLLFPNTKLIFLFVPVPVAAKIVVPILILLDLFSGVTGFSLFGGGIAHFAHIGGAIIGFLLMLYWRKPAAPQVHGDVIDV